MAGWLDVFYWRWWISWLPFVGVFIARISRGRTIREFMIGVMFVPTTIAFFWLWMSGGNAIWQELHMGAGVASADGASVIQTVRTGNCQVLCSGPSTTSVQPAEWAT